MAGTSRFRWFAAGFALGIGLALVVAASMVWARYQPLTASGGAHAIPSDGVADDGGDPARVTTYRHGEPYEYSFTLSNHGRVGVTVQSIPTDWATHLALTEIRTREMGRNNCFGCRDDSDAFEPFALGPGESREIFVRSRYDRCTDGHIGTILYGVHIRYRVFGLRRSVTVPLPTSVHIRPPEGIEQPLAFDDCPVQPRSDENHGYVLDARLSVNLRPRVEVVLAQWASVNARRSFEDCVIEVTARGRTYTSRVDRLDEGRTVYLPARRFSDDRATWDPSVHHAERVAAECRVGRARQRIDVILDPPPAA